MNSRLYSILSYVLLGISAILLVFSIWFSTMVIWYTPGLHYDPTPSGLVNMMSMFDVPIKTLAGCVVTLTLWAALGRLSQLQLQLELNAENNLFNNYYKHIDEFVKYMSQETTVEMFEKITRSKSRWALTLLYKTHYSDNFRQFTPHISAASERSFRKVHEAIVHSNLVTADQDLSLIPNRDLEAMQRLLEPTALEIVNPVIENPAPQILHYLTSTNMNTGQRLTELERYRLISRIYWSNAILSSILAFDGKVLGSIEHFAINYEEYLDFLGQRQ